MFKLRLRFGLGVGWYMEYIIKNNYKSTYIATSFCMLHRYTSRWWQGTVTVWKDSLNRFVPKHWFWLLLRVNHWIIHSTDSKMPLLCCLETLGFTVALFGSIYIGRVKDKATKRIVQKASYLLSSSVLNYYIKETSYLQLCHCSL